MLMRRRKRQQVEKEKRIGMREAGRFNAQVMDFIRPFIQPGITTGELDRLVHEYTLDHGHIPASLNYQGFPKSCCTSVNEVICHGIPGDYVLKDGDIVNIDITSVVDGWHGDQSETFLIGRVSEEARRVTQCAFDCLWTAIDNIKPNCRVSDGDCAVGACPRFYGGQRLRRARPGPKIPPRSHHFARPDPGRPPPAIAPRRVIYDRAHDQRGPAGRRAG